MIRLVQVPLVGGSMFPDDKYAIFRGASFAL
jgi:hypothetical protein